MYYIISYSQSFHCALKTMTSLAEIFSSSTMATTSAHSPLRKLLVHLLAFMLLVNPVTWYWRRILHIRRLQTLHAEILVINDRQVLLVLFLRSRAESPSLPALFSATGPFAKIRLPQPGKDGKFFVVAVFLPRCFAHALPVIFTSH